MQTLKQKTYGEIITVTYDFTSQVPTDAVLTAPSVSAVVFTGEDESPDNLISGSASVSGLQVTQKIKEGELGVVYLLVCNVVVGSTNYQQEVYLAITSDVGTFDPGTGLEITGDLPDALASDNYYQTLDIIGDYPPFGPLSINAGTFPSGWTSSVVGDKIVVQGVARDTGTFNFTYKLYDRVFNIAYSVQEVYIPPVDLYGTIPTSAYLNVAYTGHYDAQYGMPPYAFSLFSGALPTGIVLNSSTCYFTGTPTVIGVFPITTGVTDDISETDSIATTITVYASDSVMAIGSATIPPPTLSLSTGAIPGSFTRVTSDMDTFGVGIAWSDGIKIIAGASTSDSIYSTDAGGPFTTWTLNTAPAVTFGLGLVSGVLAMMNSGDVYTTINYGSSWSGPYAVGLFSAYTITSDHSTFLVLGGNGATEATVAHSTTPSITPWDTFTFATGAVVRGGCWAGSNWVFVTDTGDVYTLSADFVTAAKTLDLGTGGGLSVSLDSNDAGNVVLMYKDTVMSAWANKYSLDNGVTWADGDFSATTLGVVQYFKGIFVTRIKYSYDGSTWATQLLSAAGNQMEKLAGVFEY